jgi:hypothetical protein
VPGCRRDFFDPSKRDAGSLLGGKRIIRGLQNDAGTQVSRPYVHMAPDLARLRIALKPSGKPPEPRRLVIDHRNFPKIENAPEAVVRDRDPDGPDERLIAIEYRDFQAAPDIMFDAVNCT